MGQDGRGGGYGAQLPQLPKVTSKIRLHMEQFTLKNKWELAALIQPGLQERLTCNWIGRDYKWLDWDLCPWEGTQRKQENTQLEAQQGEWVLRAMEWMPQSWGPTQQRQAPLTGGRTVGTNRRAVKSLDSSCEECAHTGLHGKGELKPWSWLTCFPWLH